MRKKPAKKLTHFNAKGQAHMIDTGAKAVTERIAVAKGYIAMAPATVALIKSGKSSKGDVLGVARLAGIMGAKKTSDLIPLCHPLSLNSVSLDFNVLKTGIDITATCKITAQTGIEMEALTAVSIAALTLYDMVKAVDKKMQIGQIRLVHKSGGKSGVFEAS